VPATTGNLLLDALSPDLRDTILALCRAIDLPNRTLLHEQGEAPAHVYFLCTGVASLIVTMAEGGSAEVGLTGHEGVVGAMQLLGRTPTASQSCILVQGAALRIRLDDLRAIFLTSEEFRGRILEFVQQQNIAVEQVAACNKLHEAEQRLARWLLMCRDRSEQDTMTLTQEFMADMLGTRRTTVTLVASSLQERGLISYRRGKVTIVSRENLEKAACDCYRVCKEALNSLYLPTGHHPNGHHPNGHHPDGKDATYGNGIPLPRVYTDL
jgi:CRP-like cAMP-binding protein